MERLFESKKVILEYDRKMLIQDWMKDVIIGLNERCYYRIKKDLIIGLRKMSL